MKIAMITTVRHNVGDDFVRDGIVYLLRQYFKNQELHFQNIHKHAPITARYGFENIRSRIVSTILDVIPCSVSKDRILEADLIVQCGAPVYWCHGFRWGAHCAHNEWYGPLIRKRFSRNKKTKLLNVAAGTCQRYHSDGLEFCNKCLNYAKDFYKIAAVTTVRDRLAKDLLSSIGLEAPLMPCTSIFAVDEYDVRSKGEEYIVLNYMEGSAHYTFGQNINKMKWKHEFSRFYHEIRKHEKVVFVCHNQKELQEAKKLDPQADVFYSTDYLDYIDFYSRAKFGIVNRVHGAFLMASFGKPAVVIGNDSRAKMVSEIGLESFFVNDINFEFLMEQYEYLNNGANNFIERFKALKRKAYDDYIEALSVMPNRFIKRGIQS